LKIENKNQKNRKTQKIVISLCLLRLCLLRVLWCSVCFCTGHFVMLPINLTCPHCLQHFFFEHLFHLYNIFFKIFLMKSPYKCGCDISPLMYQGRFNCSTNINWRDVQTKNVVNNVDTSYLRAPWQNGPYTN